MRRESVLDYLEKSGFEIPMAAYYGSTDYLQICCPFARITHAKRSDSRPSFSIRCVDGEPSTYQCFTCKEKGVLWDMLKSVGSFDRDKGMMQLGTEAYAEDEDSPEARMERAIKDYDRDSPVRGMRDTDDCKRWFTRLSTDHPDIVEYLDSRNLEFAFLSEYFEFKWDEDEDRLVLPIYGMDKIDLRDLKNKFVGAVGRCADPDTPLRYKNYFMTEARWGLGRPMTNWPEVKKIIITEGPFDMVRTAQNLLELGLEDEYYPVCTFTSNASAEQLGALEENGCSVVVLYDNDEAGNEGWLKIQKTLEGKVPTLKRGELPKDVDPGDLLPNELENILNSL